MCRKDLFYDKAQYFGKKHFSFCEVSSQYTRTLSMASITLVLKTSLPANKEDK